MAVWTAKLTECGKHLNFDTGSPADYGKHLNLMAVWMAKLTECRKHLNFDTQDRPTDYGEIPELYSRVDG